MERIPAPGDLYRHVTDKVYQVITVAAHADSGERMIVYQAMFGEFGIFTMPLDRFLGGMDSQQHLFEKIERTDIAYQRPEGAREDRYKPGTDGRNMQQYRSVTAEEQDSGGYGTRQQVQDTAQSQSRVRERPHVQRPADSRRIFSQDPAEESDRPYFEKRQRQMEEREQRRGMFRKAERHETATEELHANPCLLKFLEADTYEERFHVLNQIQDEITDRLIDDMAVVLDVVIPEGDLSDRFHQLRDIILTRQKYETNRFR